MSFSAIAPVWRRSTLLIAVVGSLLMWASLPPLALSWLGWIAPVPWLLLVNASELPGRRPYFALYVAGVVFWLPAIYWICLPYVWLWIGWLALSAYLSIYLPLFVGITRIAVHRFSMPLWLAAPIAWAGLELARAHIMTGFLMASLAHSQVSHLTLIQISDLFGEYGVDFMMLVVAGCIAEILWIADCGLRIADYRIPTTSGGRAAKLRRCVVVAVPGIVVVAAALLYGNWRLSEAATIASTADAPGPRVALIQGNSQPDWKLQTDREQAITDEYIGLSKKAVAAARKTGNGRAVDLVIWPETMYRKPLRDFDPAFTMPPSVKVTPAEVVAGDQSLLAGVAKYLGVPILVGVDRFHFVADDRSTGQQPTMQAYNSSALVMSNGKLVGTYDKMHRVMFGEYIPFADWVPYLYQLTPLTGGIVAGKEPAALHLSDRYCLSPNICYETAIPHVIRWQVAALEARSERPAALVNLTNDSWYRGSSELDMHLACDVFRAVETRVPLVIAANGGISASIDRTGRVAARLGKQKSEYLIADVEPGYMRSWYVAWGDWFAAACLAACLFFVIVEYQARRALRARPVAPPADSD